MKQLPVNSVPFRLRSERQRIGGTQRHWADCIGVGEKTWRRWELGDTPIPSDQLEALSEHRFDVLFILTGVRCEKSEVPNNARTLNEEQIKLLDTWYHVPQRARQVVLDLMAELIPQTVFDGQDEIEFLDPDRVHDMTQEELDAHHEKRKAYLKSISPATKARKKRAKLKKAQKEKEKV